MFTFLSVGVNPVDSDFCAVFLIEVAHQLNLVFWRSHFLHYGPKVAPVYFSNSLASSLTSSFSRDKTCLFFWELREKKWFKTVMYDMEEDLTTVRDKRNHSVVVAFQGWTFCEYWNEQRLSPIFRPLSCLPYKVADFVKDSYSLFAQSL